MLQVTVETTGRLLIGSEIGAALTTLDALKLDVVGLNCATGPAEMTEHLRYLSQHARPFISCLPNAGLPSVVDGKTHYDLTPEQLADAHERFVTEFGVNIVGGCCGTTPEHLRQVVERVGDRAPVQRTPDHEPGASSVYSHVPFHQDTSILLIGERTNANGSRKFRDAMLEEDWDTCVQIARPGQGRRARPRRVRRLRRARRRDRHERDRRPLRDAGAAPARPRLDRGARARSRPPALRRQGHPELRQPRGRRRPRISSRQGLLARARVRRGRHLPRDRRGGPGAAPWTGRSGCASASTTSPSTSTASIRPTSSSTR